MSGKSNDLSQRHLNLLGNLLKEQKWDELLITVGELREKFGDDCYLFYCEGKAFRMHEKFPDAIDAYQKALLLLQPGDFYFSIKKDLAIAFQQYGELGHATRELLEVVSFFENAIEKSGAVDARDSHFLELKKSLSGAVNSLGLTHRMHASQVYESGTMQTNEGRYIEASDKISVGDQLVVSAAKCYQRALQIEHENFEDLFPDFLNEFLRQNNIMDGAVDDTLKLDVSLEYRSGDLEYCLFLANYLNLAIQIFGSDIEGFKQDYRSLKELYRLTEALMPKGHYYHQKWLQVQETAKLNEVQFDM